MRRLGIATSLVLGSLLFSAVPGQAATEGRIDSVTSSGDKLSILFSATSLQPGEGIDPASVAVTVEGQPVRSEVKSYDEAGGAQRTAVLTLDVSGSMRGAGIAGAKAAADSFLSTVPDDVRVGLVTFGDTARLAVAPTTDHGKVADTVAGLNAGGDTALYDGVVAATKAAGSEGSRSVIVLSDGKDEGSKASLGGAKKAVADSEVGLDAVVLGEGGKQAAAALSQLAEAGSGQVFGAREGKDLEAAFAASAASLESQLQITAQVPTGTDEAVSVQVSAKSGDATVTDSAVALVEPRVAAPQVVGPESASISSALAVLANPVVIGGALLLLFLGGALLLGFALTASDSDSGRLHRRLGSYAGIGARQGGSSQGSGSDLRASVARSAVEFADRVSQKRGFDQKLGLKLDAAGISLKPAEWLLIQAGATVLGLLVIALISGFSPIAMLLGGAIGFAIPYLVLAVKSSRRRSEFNQVLPDTLTLVAGSLSAGHSIIQAFDTVVRETSGVVHDELGRAIVETRLGVDVQEALEGVAERMGSEDFRWVVMAIKVNREIGGDLAEVLRNVAFMLRERDRLRRQVKALSAEGRLSAVIIVALLPVLVLYLAIVRPEYIALLISDPLGIAMSVMSLALLAAGALWISKIVKIEV